MRAAVLGFGAVGRRVAAQLASDPRVEYVTVVHRDPARAARIQAQHLSDFPAGGAGKINIRRGGPGTPLEADVTVIAVPAGVRRAALAAVDHGGHVVCPADDPADVRALLSLDERARLLKRSIVVGSAMAPGLSCLLASRLSGDLDEVEEIHVASLGTGGPACARRHHAALAGISVDWIDGTWRRRAGGSGRELVWFPEPVGGADCYRGALADPLLLAPVFSRCRRITSRVAATRRDRLTSALPMMRPPHPEGLVGAVRVEVRGRARGRAETLILGTSAPPAVVAAFVSARAALWAASGRLARPGAAGLAAMVAEPGLFLKELAESAAITVSAFLGADAGPPPDPQPTPGPNPRA